MVHTDTTTAPLSVPLERWESYYPAVRTCRMPSPELDLLWKGDAANTTSFLEAACPFCTLIGCWRAEGTQFNFPSQVHKTSTSTATGPIHNSLLVMCVLNTAEIYMGSICKFCEPPPPAPFYKLYLLNRQHEQQHVTQTAPSGQRWVRARVSRE